MSHLVWLRVLLVASIAGLVVLSLAFAPWKTQLIFSSPGVTQSYILGNVNAPVWNPPPLPPRQRFEEKFEDIPKSGGVIVVELLWDEMILGVLPGMWPIAIVFTILYHATRGDRIDPVFVACTRLAWTFPVWGGVCVLLWCIVGGWGPPAISCFVILAFGHGTLLGLWRRKTARGAENCPPVS